MVVAWAIDAQGETMYPRKWNHGFIDMPFVKKNEQRRPSLTNESVTARITRTNQPMSPCNGFRVLTRSPVYASGILGSRTGTICVVWWKYAERRHLGILLVRGQMYTNRRQIGSRRTSKPHSSRGPLLLSGWPNLPNTANL